MKAIAILNNPIQEYAWGSYTAIPELLGTPSPAARPQAELWMGAHPKAPSRVALDGTWVSLAELIAARPDEILGPAVNTRFGGRLPYLFKVLAAARPLSIQAHPSKAQAEAGFARENAAGIPLDAPQRNYRDDNHKPECICALTAFVGLNGFCAPDAIARRLADLGAVGRDLAGRLDARPPTEGLRAFFEALMTLDPARRGRLLAAAARHARPRSETDAACRWVLALQAAYGDDVGVLAPFFLNLVTLAPGEALFLRSGELHAYLQGTGIELMANSDNVLRGGLTPKHVDVPELVRVLNFEPRTVEVLTGLPGAPGERVYPTGAAEFVLSVVTVDNRTPYARGPGGGVEILLCTAGEAQVWPAGGGPALSLPRGASALVPAAAQGYTLNGTAQVYKAAVAPAA